MRMVTSIQVQISSIAVHNNCFYSRARVSILTRVPCVKTEYSNHLHYNAVEELKKTFVIAKERYSITGELLNIRNGIRKSESMVILYNPSFSVYPSSSTTYREM